MNMDKTKYVLTMEQLSQLINEDRVLSRPDKIQVIEKAVCSVFRYRAGLADWRNTELDNISTMWANVHKKAWISPKELMDPHHSGPLLRWERLPIGYQNY